MEQLIKIRDNGSEKLVSAHELYTFLGIKRDFSNWCKKMFSYGFEENKDYSLIIGQSESKGVFAQKGENLSEGGRPIKDYALTLDCAKEIAMIQRTEKGKQARQYFIACEKQLKTQTKTLSPKEMALLVIAAEEEKERLEISLEHANKTILTQAPKIEYVNKVLNAENCHTTTTIAKELGLSAKTLNEILKNKQVQYLHDGHWVLYAKYQNQQFTKTRTHTYYNSEGKQCSSIQTVWTEKGRLFVHQILTQIQKVG